MTVRAGILLTVYDTAVTAVALTMLGAREVNPLLAGAMGEVGVAGTLTVRLAAGCLLVGWLGWAATRSGNRWGDWPLRLVVVLLGAVGVWNTGVLGWLVLAG